jgi:hypothetical protein
MQNVPARYEIRSRTVVYAASDTLTPIDSIFVVATALIQPDEFSSGRLALTGTVDHLSVTAGLAAGRSTETLQTPFTLSWVVTPDSVTAPTRQPEAACDQLHETARDILVALIPPLPESIAATTRWSTESSLESCRAGLSFRVTATSALSPADFATAAQLRQLTITGQGVAALTGQGVQGATNMILKGTGSMAGEYVLSLVTGQLQSSRTRSDMRVEFDLGYRTDRFVQQTVREVRRLE